MPGQQLAGLGGGDDAHSPVRHALREPAIERYEFEPDLLAVLVDGGEQRWIARDARHGAFHVGLVDSELGGVDRLGARHTLLDGFAPGLVIHRLALPQRGISKLDVGGACSEDAVDMTLDAPTGDGETELLPI